MTPAPDLRRLQAEEAERRARDAVRAADAAAVAATFHALAGADPDAALCGALRAGTQVLDADAPALAGAAATAHLRALRDRPLEPDAWALQARLLAAAGDAAAAGACADAARRLDALDASSPADAVAGAPHGLGAASAALARAVSPPDPASQRLSLAMIVRDEEAMLPDCLASVRDVVDEMVVVDTGSSDRTAEIARSFGAVVLDVPWTGSFAAARNAALERVTGDWVLVLDADERLEPGEVPALRRELARIWRTVLRVRMTNLTGEEGLTTLLTASMLRIWRSSPAIRYVGAVHEQVVGLPEFCAARFEETPIRFVHHGYRADVIRAAGKRDRNLAMLQAELARPGGDRDAFVHFNLGTEHLLREDHAEAARAFERSLALLEEAGTPLPAIGYGSRLVLRLARALRLAGEPGRGEAVATRWTAAFPDYADLAVEAALSAGEAGDLERALGMLDAALARADDAASTGETETPGLRSHVGAALRGELLVRLGRHAEAAATYRRGLAQNPDYVAGIGRLAESLLALGTPPASVLAELEGPARRHLRAAGPLLAGALAAHGDTEAADRLFEETLRAHPDAVDARLGLAESALLRGDIAAAAARCEPLPDGREGAGLARCAAFCALVDEDPDRALGVLEHPAGRALPDADREAFAAWLGALRSDGDGAAPLSPEAARAALDALATAIRLERLAACDVLYRLVRESRMPTGDAHEELGQRFFAGGFTEIAAEEWMAAVRTGEPRGRSLLGLAQVALSQELLEDARELAAEAERVEPGLPGAALMVRRLDALLSRRTSR